MGVLGLTTFIRENERTLGQTVNRGEGAPPIQVVVDGWSFIYYLARSVPLPWVYGGEYALYYQAVSRVVQALLDAGLKLYFVFDGALPPSKFSTRIKRSISNFVVPSELFFRTSSYARSTPRFLAETHIQPPLYYLATLEALSAFKEKAVEVHMADDDADKFAVELAGQLGAYCLSNDSDYIILNCEGYEGYISFADLRWSIPPSVTPLASPAESTGSISFDELGFQTVTKAKSRKKAVQPTYQFGLIPPDGATSLSFTSYHPEDLAHHLKIPVSLLSLFASLIGNDFTEHANPARQFFDQRTPASKRVNRVTTVLQSLLQPAKKKSGLSTSLTGMELIKSSVDKLLMRPNLVLGLEREKLVEAIIDSILKYAIIPSASSEPKLVCSVHDAESCPLDLLHVFDFKEEELDPDKLKVRDAYVDAYRRGRFSHTLLSTIGSGSFWPKLMLEDPDKETCQTSIGRGIRQWVYALLEDTIGIGRIEEDPTENSLDGDQELPEDENELIDVVEENSDWDEEESIAYLQGALGRASLDQEGANEASVVKSTLPLIQAPEDKPLSPAVVTEYVRRGTRVTESPIEVATLSALLPDSVSITHPPQLRSLEERRTLFLVAMESCTQKLINNVPSQYLIYVVCLRWVIRSLGERSNAEERWTKREAQCILATVLSDDSEEGASDEVLVELVNRNIQLTAQFLSTLFNTALLVEALLLTDETPVSSLPFSGKRFHQLLQSPKGVARTDDMFKNCWAACEEGMDTFWGIERGAKVKKQQRKEKKAATPVKRGVKGVAPSTSLFAALADMDVDA